MRIALKIGYDGSAFCGHQRQPDARRVEGECIAAAKSARLFSDPRDAFFRSASRTDREVSAVGNVIAFDTDFRPDAVVGALNDRAHDVWAWAYAVVPPRVHPRHAVERLYRDHLFDDLPIEKLREAGAEFVGAHDLRSFTTDPPGAPFQLDSIEARRDEDAIAINLRARSFRRGMVRRIVAAMVAYAEQETSLEMILGALHGRYRDFGKMPPEPLFLMDVRYNFPFQTIPKPKVLDEWRSLARGSAVRLRFAQEALALSLSERPQTHSLPGELPETFNIVVTIRWDSGAGAAIWSCVVGTVGPRTSPLLRRLGPSVGRAAK